MAAEPTLEDLSAYLDKELPGASRQELEAHLAECEDCRRRLRQLGNTAAAIRGLPVAAPPRAFSVPAQRRQLQPPTPWLWAGAAAAAVLVGALLLPLVARPAGTTAGSGAESKRALGADQRPGFGPAAPAGGSRAVTVRDPSAPGTSLTLYLPSATYSPGESVNVTVSTSGKLPAALTVQLETAGRSARISLVHPGAAADVWTGSYRLGADGWSGAPGQYSLVATETLPGSQGQTLVAATRIAVR